MEMTAPGRSKPRIAPDRHRRQLGKIADELDLLILGTFTGPAGRFRQTAELAKAQPDLLAKLKIPLPKKIRDDPSKPLTSSDATG
jgi:hypothetical protein